MELSHFLEHVKKHAGTSEEVAREASDQTLEVLGELLTESTQHAVARELPDELAEALQRCRPDGDFGLEEFYERIQLREEPPGGYNVEHAQAVCMGMSETLDDETRTRLQNSVPDEYRELFEPREIDEIQRAERHGSREADDRKLSSGRPGSSRPLSEAKGSAHSDSVVNADEPRASRKLASSHGSPHEGRDLSTGRPDGDVNVDLPDEPDAEPDSTSDQEDDEADDPES